MLIFVLFAEEHVLPVSVYVNQVFLARGTNSQTESLLIPLENDIGRQRSCAAICFLVIVPPVQVVAAWRQSKRRPA